MTTLKEKLDAMLLNLEEGSAGLVEIRRIAKALDKAVEQRNEYIFYEYEPYSHALKVINEDSAELIAILEGAE